MSARRHPAAGVVAACSLLALGLALGGAAGCASKARISSKGNPCTDTSQCVDGQACFLGACRGPAGALSTVLAEVRPPNDSRYGLLQVRSVDLSRSVIVDFAVGESLAVSGTVGQASELPLTAPTPVVGAALAFTARVLVIPERLPGVTLQTDTSGSFSAKLPDATWDVTVLPPAPLPPVQDLLGLNASDPSLDLLIPPASRLLRASGQLSAGGKPLAGARVLAVDAQGVSLGAAASTNDSGEFQLLLPPEVTGFSLRVGPPADATAVVSAPIPTFDPVGPFAIGTPVKADLGALPDPVALSGKVVDQAGLPVANARVYALSLDGQKWVISRSGTAGPDGTFSLPLRAGSYALAAAPGGDTSEAALSAEQVVTVQAGAAPLVLSCPPKVTATGLVRRPDGGPVGAGTQLNATRLPDRLVSGRVAQAKPTDASGHYQLIGDAGQYRLEVVPTNDSGLPRRVVQVTLGTDGAALPDVQLPPPVETVGTVSARGTTTPIAGAAVEFFALDADGMHVLSLGSALTDAKGQFKVVLPDVAQPAALAP